MADRPKKITGPLWHPYTQMKDHEQDPPVFIEKADGLRLFDNAGKEYIDAISSWWCTLHGHNHPVMMEAIMQQVRVLDHVLFAGFTHGQAMALAEKLIEISPDGLNKVFFSDNGSTSVETALKMSRQYRVNSGMPEKRVFASLDRGYHGDTCGAMSVGGRSVFTEKFSDMLFETVSLPSPYCYRCPCSQEKSSCAYECIEEARKILETKADEITALILEPLVMGASGIIIYPVEYLREIRKITKRLDIHLIADEVATGFGRTGKLFACDHAEVSPDFMCVSKSLTSGTLPLSATLTTDEIYNAFYGDLSEMRTFYHGHTYTANPIACAAANASLDLLLASDHESKTACVEERVAEFLDEISSHPNIGDVRNIGVIGAFELVKDKAEKRPFDLSERVAYNIAREALSDGLILRPLGDVLYFFLPLSTTYDDLEIIFSKTRKALKNGTMHLDGSRKA